MYLLRQHVLLDPRSSGSIRHSYDVLVLLDGKRPALQLRMAILLYLQGYVSTLSDASHL